MPSGNTRPNLLPHTTVVGIGASAGGVKALGSLLEGIPANTGASFVIIIHLDPRTHSDLPKILAAHTRMPVTAVTDLTQLQPDHVYVIPPDRELRITQDSIAAVPFAEPRGLRTPIDSFFRSLAAHHGDGFAVILTGGGSDGAVGIKAVKESGGIILVQDPAEAEHPSMPSAAISTEVVDFVLPLKQLTGRLAELIQSKGHVTEAQRTADEEENLRRILAHLRVRTGHDFSHYKRSTVMRRLLRRMQVTRKEQFEQYFSYLREHVEGRLAGARHGPQSEPAVRIHSNAPVRWFAAGSWRDSRTERGCQSFAPPSMPAVFDTTATFGGSSNFRRAALPPPIQSRS